LRVASAGRASLDAEARPERRLAERDDRALAQPVERLAEPDGRRRLALARRSRSDRGDEHERSLGAAVATGDRADVDLGLVAAVRDEVGGVEPHVARDLLDRAQS